MLALVLSAGACNNFDRVPIPPPDELGAEPFPEGATVGGIDATFGRPPESTGGEHDGCGSYYRFRPDGSVVQTPWDCRRDSETFDEFVERAATHYTAAQGDYAVMGQQVLLRLVERDMLAQEMLLYLVDADICGDRMTSHTRGSVISAGRGSENRVLTLLSGSPVPPTDACDLASFAVARRSLPYAGEDDAEMVIATDPGRPCSLSYVGADGVRFPAGGTLDVVADEVGECTFTFPPGTRGGAGIATVTVGRYARDVELTVSTRSERFGSTTTTTTISGD